MNRKSLILSRNQTVFANKEEAILKMTEFISDNSSDFHDGETIILRYYNNGETASVNTIVNIIDNGNGSLYISLSPSIEEYETLKVTDSLEEPSDKTALWITDYQEGDLQPERYSEEINALREKINELTEIINRHEYALTHTIAGGDFITNSMKYELENEHEPQIPDFYLDKETTGETISGDTEIVDFDLYIANTNLKYYSDNNTTVKLYKWQKYFLKKKFFNAEQKEVVNYGDDIEFSFNKEGFVTINNNCLVSDKEGLITITAAFNGITKEYTLSFTYSEEVCYESYLEPNVKHVTIKKADTLDILRENTNYLCVNELVWCKGNNTLYLKAETSKGTIKLIPLNGGGGGIDVPDSGDDSGTTTPDEETTLKIEIVDDVLEINGDTSKVYVDENGYLVFNTSVANINNGILTINK